MKQHTNYQPGPRGINLENGLTRWVETGETVETDGKTLDGVKIVGGLPDFGKPPAQSDEDAELTAAVEAENADLKDRVADLEEQLRGLRTNEDQRGKAAEVAAESIASLEQQVAELTAENEK